MASNMAQDKAVYGAARGEKTIDGAGVHLVRVIGNWNQEFFDPFLMLDSFDSTNPEDYMKGFPMHPHRGIETITYLIEGEIEHTDNLGNHGSIYSGESQWMTSGSGIIHQEMPSETPRLLGLQIWLNLAQKDKMTTPTYFNIEKSMVKVKAETFGRVHVISGNYKDIVGVQPDYQKVSLFDVEVEAGKTAVIPTNPGENVFVFLIVGPAIIDGETYEEKYAVVFEEEGDQISVTATPKEAARFIFFSGKKLKEPVAWGGPVVMNTEEELALAFEEMDNGDFIKEAPNTEHIQ
jgi:redox-sensitive bicupin YhaK (pirin superfamily)